MGVAEIGAQKLKDAAESTRLQLQEEADKIKAQVEKLQELAAEQSSNAVSEENDVFDDVTGFIGNATTDVGDALDSATTAVGEATGAALDGAIEIGGAAVDGVVDGVNAAVEGVMDATNNFTVAVSGLFA